jgi:O-antigen ligase
MIDTRYASLYNNINPPDGNFTGRTKIMALDLEIFRDNFLMGVGPGAARDLRWRYGYGTVVGAHSEFTRMLAEHGLFGLISLLSILILSFKEYKKRADYNKVILGCMSIFGILTMFHSAFRIALPGYIYGLSYVILRLQEK